MNNIFQNKKILIAIGFSVFYTIMLLLNIDLGLPFFQNFRYTINSLLIYLMPLITPVLVLVFLFALNKEYRLKKWLLPVAFGVSCINSIISVISSFCVISIIFSNPLHITMFFCSLLILVANLFIFIGTLFDFKYINLFKYGALANIVVSLVLLVVDFIQVGGFTYIQSVPDGIPAINFVALIRELAQILFYLGIFILATNKRAAHFE